MVICLLPIAPVPGLSHQDRYAVAYSARYYYPPTVKKLSHSRLYTCALDGSHRRCWTRERGEVRDVWWKSKNVLGYSVEFPNGHGGGTGEKWELNILANKRILTATGTLDELEGDRARSPWSGLAIVDAEVELKKLGHDVRFHLKEGTVSINHNAPLQFPDPIWWQDVDKKADRLWLFTYTHDSTTGADYSAYLVNWKTNRAEPKLTHAQMVDFRMDRTTYAMVSQRATTPYDKKRTVWMTQAIIGDWKTGEHHLIAGPAILNDLDLRQPFPVTAKHPDRSYQFAVALRP